MGGKAGQQEKSKGTDYAPRDDRWHDGRPILGGFALDPLGVPTDKWCVYPTTPELLLIYRFEMPDIPADWRPRPARVWGTTKKWDEGPDHKPEEKETIRGAPGRPLTFEQVSFVSHLWLNKLTGSVDLHSAKSSENLKPNRCSSICRRRIEKGSPRSPRPPRQAAHHRLPLLSKNRQKLHRHHATTKYTSRLYLPARLPQR